MPGCGSTIEVQKVIVKYFEQVEHLRMYLLPDKEGNELVAAIAWEHDGRDTIVGDISLVDGVDEACSLCVKHEIAKRN